MAKIKAFLDTSVLIGKVLKISKNAEKVFNDSYIEKYTNECALKELYHVLKNSFNFSEENIGYAIDYIRETCIILPAPKKEEFKKIKLQDKSDRPIVYSAHSNNLILFIDDEKTYQDAKNYVEVRRICRDKSRKR
jgi:predicted nucleic acid-binding protein